MAINPADLSYYSVWLLTHDDEFLRQNAQLKANVFPRGELRYLVSLALRHYAQFKVPLTLVTLKIAMQNDDKMLKRNGITAADAETIFSALELQYKLTAKEIPSARTYCRTYLEQKTFDYAVEQALKAPTLSDSHAVLEGAKLRDEELRSVSMLDASSPDFLQTIRGAQPGEISFGLYEIDNLWRGGYRPGEIGIIAAPTGVGKSMCLCAMAAAAFWAGKRVLYYTFELTDQQIMGRVAYAILEQGEVDVPGTWAVELAKAAKAKGVPLPTGTFEARAGMLTWPELVADLEQYKRDYGQYPDLLVLDSADDLQPLHNRDKVHEQLKDAYTFMRQLALKNKMAIWTSGQLNRDSVEKARVNLRYIGDAFAKAQRSHYVLAFAQTPTQQVSQSGPEMRMYILKDSQYGSTGWALDLKPYFGSGIQPDAGYAGYKVLKSFRDNGGDKKDKNNGKPA